MKKYQQKGAEVSSKGGLGPSASEGGWCLGDAPQNIAIPYLCPLDGPVARWCGFVSRTNVSPLAKVFLTHKTSDTSQPG